MWRESKLERSNTNKYQVSDVKAKRATSILRLPISLKQCNVYFFYKLRITQVWKNQYLKFPHINTVQFFRVCSLWSHAVAI